MKQLLLISLYNFSVKSLPQGILLLSLFITEPSSLTEILDLSLSPNSLTFSLFQDTYRRRQMQRTVTRQMSFDLTKLLVTEDWFSDISPQTMRRLLNIVSVTGDFCFSLSSVRQ